MNDLMLGNSGGAGSPFDRISRFRPNAVFSVPNYRRYWPNSGVARLLALLRERRLEEAAGAALALSPSERSRESPNLNEEVLTSLGLSWETLFAGFYLDAFCASNRRFDNGSKGCLFQLGACGSDKGAGLLLALARLTATCPEERGAFIQPLSKLIPVEQVQESQSPTEMEALALLNDIASPETPVPSLVDLVETLARLRRPQAISTLRRLTAHPVVRVADSAREALLAFAETVSAR